MHFDSKAESITSGNGEMGIGNSKASTRCRKSYQAPELMVYGLMEKLTASGSGCGSENRNHLNRPQKC